MGMMTLLGGPQTFQKVYLHFSVNANIDLAAQMRLMVLLISVLQLAKD